MNHQLPRALRCLSLAIGAASLILAGCIAPEAPIPSTTPASSARILTVIPGTPGIPDTAECQAQWECFCGSPSVCADICHDNTSCTDPDVEPSFDCKVCGATRCADLQTPCADSYPADPPYSCAGLYSFPTCSTGYTDPPPCDETITEGCVSDGDLVCGPLREWTSCCLADDSGIGAVCTPILVEP